MKYAVFATIVLLLGTPVCVSGQGVFFGAGVGAASLPRSLEPLCRSARRLSGPTFSAQAGLHANRLRLSSSLDVTSRGYREVAECVPRTGISVDSIFAANGNSAVAAAGAVGFMATPHLDVNVGAGWVHDHDSWFMSGGVGWQYRKLRAEITARRHRISYDVVTREFTSQGVREISRSAHTENAWGGAVRLLLVTR